MAEIFASIERTEALLPPAVAARTSRRARRHYAVFAVEEAYEVLKSSGDWGQASMLLGMARQHSSALALAAGIGKMLARGSIRFIQARQRPKHPATSR